MQLSLSVQQKFKSHDCQTRMFADTDEQNNVGKKIYRNSSLAEGQLTSTHIQVAIHNIVHHLQYTLPKCTNPWGMQQNHRNAFCKITLGNLLDQECKLFYH